MAEQVVRRIGVVSLAKVFTIIYAIYGLIYGIFWAIIGSEIVPSSLTGFGGAGAIIYGLIGGAIAGFVGGAISAIFYNGAASLVGGVKLEFKNGTFIKKERRARREILT